ncbi:hypothetical protein CFC21_039738 [Triticum aestivum]|uniref:Knottin scorpion toxin-like domain-containing protein n=3 Tax=Triticum TaxID=4564 RepID=A0A9R1FEQ4_WHEAT|nr:uncharacterized protein LOC119280796 [Triticum dicoccoides]XP_044344119.1 uncharacterized protein LOC123064786 [Triticum aestivum]KAF7027717.1 hypothetical protein CFC21_039738 [Triticum aestivum]CDM81221.1 unnamed protein product [Triticum aestivum]VAH72376.1 unnamed protein product [Triticum turgidum subsp. durum]
MAMLKKNTSALCCFVAALMVVMAATLLFSSCDADKKMDKPRAFPLPASCYSKYFPNCTDESCKRFCGSGNMSPVPEAFCNDNNNCCCPI